MAYQTGSVVGPDALVAALSTFMQANGWTLIDTLEASRDLVFRSLGSSGKAPMIMRVSTSTKTTPFNIKYLAHPSRCVPHVVMRGYHLWYTPSGTPMTTPVNGTFTPNTGGGTLAAGTYFYRISAIGATGETLASTEASATTTGSTGSVTLNWGVVSGAIGYNIYGRSTGAEQKLTTVWGGGITTFLDTNAFTPSGALPGANTAHGGLNEYGALGHSLVAGGTGSSWNGWLTEWRLDGPNGPGTSLPTNSTSFIWPSLPTTSGFNQVHAHRFTGDRLLVSPAVNSGSQFRLIDVATGDAPLTSGNPSGLTNVNNTWDLVYDAVNDKWLIYYLTNTNFTQADGFWKLDIETGIHTRCASVPWTHVASDGFVLWDGADSLYIMPGNNQTDTYKYSIASNSYTTLAAAPQGRSNNGFSVGNGASSTQFAVYIPATASGLSSDVIYTMLDDSSNVFYSYNVTSNTWNDTGNKTPNLGSAIGGQQAHGTQLIYDGATSLYYMYRTLNNLLYKLLLQSTGLGYFSGNPFDGGSAPPFCTGFILNHTVSRVKVHLTTTSTYHFIVDQDGIKVAVNNGGLGKWYWMYAGRMTTRRKPSIMTTTTSSFGPGTNITISVDSTTNYVAGDRICFFDPATGKQEATTILTVNSGTSLTLTLANVYTVGTLAGADPFQTVMTGDQGLACAPTDPKGFKADGHAAMYLYVPNWWNAVQVSGIPGYSNNLAGNTSPDGNGYFQPVEGLMYMASPLVGSLPLSKTGEYGSIPGITFLNTLGVSNGPQSGDVIPINGHNHLFFTQQSSNFFTSWRYGVVLGPTT